MREEFWMNLGNMEKYLSNKQQWIMNEKKSVKGQFLHLPAFFFLCQKHNYFLQILAHLKTIF